MDKLNEMISAPGEECRQNECKTQVDRGMLFEG